MTMLRWLALPGLLATAAGAFPFFGPPPPPGAFPGPPGPFPGPPGPPGPPPPGGPFFMIYHQLDAEQRQQLDQLLAKDRDASKAQFKADLRAFQASLSAPLREVLEREQKRFDDFRKETDARAAKMGAAAQDLFKQLKAVVDDDSLTFKQEHERARELVKKAERAVLDEFRKARVPLPGTPPPPPPPPGGPLGPLYHKLEAAQRQQLDQLLRDGRAQPKREARARLDQFVAGLPEALRQEAAAHRDHFERFKLDLQGRAAQLGEKARRLFDQIKAVMDDESITFEQDHEQIKAIVDGADRAALDELRQHHIPLPGVMPPPPPPPPPFHRH